jgi:hypothetical protein
MQKPRPHDELVDGHSYPVSRHGAAIVAGVPLAFAMHQAVLSYDQTVTQVSSEQLLLNIVRARYHRPVHVTTVSSVAATFDFRMTAGITPPEGDSRGLEAPLFSTTVAENPTLTIIPMVRSRVRTTPPDAAGRTAISRAPRTRW